MANELTSLSLRQHIRAKYAWPGGYEAFGITSDGGILCCECMRKEYRQIANARRHQLKDGWQVVAINAACNTCSRTACDHCYKVIVEGSDDN